MAKPLELLSNERCRDDYQTKEEFPKSAKKYREGEL